MTVSGAAKVRVHIRGKSTAIGAGGPTTLTLKDEQEIVITCQVLAEMEFGLTKQLVETIVLIMFMKNIFKHHSLLNDTPGREIGGGDF